MNPAYLHLLVNHFPIVLSVVGAAMIVLAIVLRRESLWRFGMGCVALAGLGALAAFFTGQAASHVMRRAWYVQRATIGAHEEAGELALWVILVAAVICAYALWRSTGRPAPGATAFPALLRILTVLGALAAAGTAGYAGYLGGKIVHEAPALAKPPAGIAAPVDSSLPSSPLPDG